MDRFHWANYFIIAYDGLTRMIYYIILLQKKIFETYFNDNEALVSLNLSNFLFENSDYLFIDDLNDIFFK